MTRRAARIYLHPYDRWYSLSQEYYARSLHSYLEACGGRVVTTSMTRFPSFLARLRRVRYASMLDDSCRRYPWIPAVVDRFARAAGGELHAPANAFHPAVGQYELTDLQGRRHRVCIDSCDYGHLPAAGLVAWSDVYFKTNFWATGSYPSNVRPLVNCSPWALRRLAALRAARTCRKDFDVCFLVHVAGGRDAREGIEHNLRLAEAVARLGKAAYVHAYLNCGDVDAQARRLARAGIPSSKHHMPDKSYWDIVARSKLTVIRLGMHDCVPWSFTGTFAIGGCAVLDRAPLSRWPQPLQAGVHFLDLGIQMQPGLHCGTEADYDAVPERLAGWLREEGLAASIAARAAAYFDDEMDPVRLGAHIFAVLESRSDTATNTAK